MFAFSEQLTRASKAVIEAQLLSATAFAHAAFDCGTTMIDLNADALRTSLAAATVASRQLLEAKDGGEWARATAKQSQLAMERIGSYGRQAAEIARGAQAKFVRVAQNEGAVSRQKVEELVDVVKKAPSSAATPVNSFLQTAFEGAHAGYDQTTQAGQSAAERGAP
ncbi:phasin family protein [Oxalobacteraceae bacterium GrIS 1.11]